MKRITMILFCFCLIMVGQAQVTKTVNITAGTLPGAFTPFEKKAITTLKVTGTLNATDFFFIRDSLRAIQILDLSKARIISPLDTIPDEAFKNKNSLKKISFPINLTRIGYASFYSCKGLLSVEIPSTVTSIGSGAFSGCGIKSVVLPITDISYYGWAFDNCDSLKVATTPYTNASGNNIFLSCNNLRQIIVPDGTTKIADDAFYQLTSMTTISLPSSLTSIGTHAFYNCTVLDSITIPEGVTSIGQGAFWQCMKMKSVKLPNSLTTIESDAFSSCSSLTSVIVPIGVTTINSSLFGGCSELVTATISNGYDGTNGQSIFWGCTKLKTIIIPDGITSIKNYAFSSSPANVTTIKIPASVKSIGDYAFRGCSGIVSIVIPDSVTSIGAYAFSGCSGLKSLTLPGAVTRLGMYSLQNCSSLTSFSLPATLSGIDEGVFSGCSKLASFSFPASVVSLGKSAFSGCTSLVLTTIPETVNSIGESCFSGCSGFKSIVIPSSISVINAAAFSGCTGLSSVQFPNSLSSIGYQAFSGCNGLTSITIPATTSITYNAFQDCKGLVIATTPYAFNSGGIFEGCINLKTILIPSGLTSIQDNAFYNCSTLDSINVPNSVYSIGRNAFNGCSSLKKFRLPKYLNSISEYALANCSSLTSISLPSTLPVISEYCFSKCSALTTVTIPASVNTIHSFAFDACTGLNSITVDASFPIDLSNNFSVFNYVIKSTCKLNVPYGSKSRYSTAYQWGDFTNIVEKTTGIFVSSNKAELSASPGSTCTIDLKSNVAWTAVSDQTWVTVTPQSGTGDNTLTFTSDNTQTSTVRRATITISSPGFLSQTIEVAQKLSPKTLDISAGGLSTALTANELNSLSTLILTGTMDARDFKILRDNMPMLENLDLSGVTISAYTGIDGTFVYGNPFFYASNSIPAYAFYNSSTNVGKVSLKSVLLPKTITSIGTSAFQNCTGLVSINIPESVNNIAYYAFYNCQGITSVYVNTGIPINMGDNWSAFNLNNRNCILYVPYASKALYTAAGQWSNFTNIVESAQGFMPGTNKVTLPFAAGSSANVDLKSNIAWTANSDQPWLIVNPVNGSGNSTLVLTAEANLTTAARKAIVTLSAPGCNSQIIEVVQNIAPKTINIEAGGLSTALTTDELNSLSLLIITGTLDARDFKTLGDKMPLLTDLDLKGTTILTYTGTDGTYQFSNPITYPANTIPDYAFYNKVNLKSIVLPSTVTAIGNSCFYNCTGLTSFIIPSTVNSLGSYAFYNCTGLTSMYVNSSIPLNLYYSYGVFYNVNGTTCSLNVPYKSKSLYADAYQWSSFTTIVESTQGFFPASGLLKVAYAAGSKTVLDISANVPWTVISDQPWLSVTPDSGTGNSQITCTSLQNDSITDRFAKVTISSPGFESQVVTVKQTGFPKTINITAGSLSTGLTTTELSHTADLIITGIMDDRDFKTLRDNMPELARLDLTGATIVSYTGSDGTWSYNTTYDANEIPTNSFYDSNSGVAKTGLLSIKLPVSATGIGYSAFRGCTGLTSITIPSTILHITNSAFQDCTGLTSIYAEPVYPITLYNFSQVFYNVNKTTCTLYVPYAAKTLYQAADQWKDFVTVIENANGFLVSQNTLKFASSILAKSSRVGIKANVAWLAQSSQSWLSLSPSVSSNDSILTLTAAPNLTDTVRKATVTVSSPGFNSQTIDVSQAAAPKKVTAGGLSSLLTTAEQNTLTDIALMGTIDARDFRTMRDKMPLLENIDMTGVNVVGYKGVDGTLTSETYCVYPDNEIPEQAFYMTSHIKTVLLPETAISMGSNSMGLMPALTSVTLSKNLKYIGSNAFVNSTALTAISIPDSLFTIGEGAFMGSGLSGPLNFNSTLKKIGLYAFYNCRGISGLLTIPASIDSVGNNAFYNCSGFSSLVINSSKTDIGTEAFSNCYSLNSVTLPANLTTIGERVFAYCWSLKSITLPSALKTIGKGAFQVTGLTAVDFPVTLTSIGDFSFANTGLINVTIPSSLTYIGDYLFSGCTSLISVSFPATLKKIVNSMFEGCTSLNPVELPMGLKSIGDNAFCRCSSLTGIYLPDSITSIGSNAFSYCTALKSVYFSSSLATIGYSAFQNCTGLSTLNIPSSVTTINYEAFSGCKGLFSVKLPLSLSLINNSVFKDCENLPSITIPTTVKSIGTYAFSGCKKLTEITIPPLVEVISEGSFMSCGALTKVDFPAGLRHIGANAFEYCTGLSDLVIPSSVVSLGDNAFNSCGGLKTVNLSKNLQTMGYSCFTDCKSLSNINFPNSLSSIGSYCFMNCISLKSVVIPPLITEIGSFQNCSNLTSVTLNSGLKSIGGFSGCGFSTIILPNTLTSIGYMAFSECKNLTTVVIPNSVNLIDDNAFSSCTNLKSINIPARVNDIGVGAFGGCSGLSSIYAYSKTPVDMSFSGDGFYGVNKGTCILYVPSGRKGVYSNTVYWKDFTNIIELITDAPALNESDIKIYPNPVKETFSITGLNESYRVILTDINGKQVLVRQVNAGETIPVGDLSKGLYFLRVVTANGTMERKLIKE